MMVKIKWYTCLVLNPFNSYSPNFSYLLTFFSLWSCFKTVSFSPPCFHLSRRFWGWPFIDDQNNLLWFGTIWEGKGKKELKSCKFFFFWGSQIIDSNFHWSQRIHNKCSLFSFLFSPIFSGMLQKESLSPTSQDSKDMDWEQQADKAGRMVRG